MGLTRPKLAQVQTTTSAFDDPIIVINNGAEGTNTKDIGIVFERGDDQNRVLLWDESADEFVLANSTEQGSTSGNVTLVAYSPLQVAGLKASSLTINSAFTFPTSDGTAGYVLSTDGAGNIGWSAAGASYTAGTGLSLLTNEFSIDSTVVTKTGTETLTNKTLTSPVISTISNTGTLTLPTTTGTVALTSDITLSTLSVTATAAELNALDGITATVTELNYTDGVTSNIQTQLNAKAALSGATFTGDVSGTNLTLSGNLTVNGTTTTVATTNTVVSDTLIELGNGTTTAANDAGIVIERGSTGDNAFMGWDESADSFVLGTTTATGASTGNLTISAAPLSISSLTLGGTAITATAAELNYTDGVTSNIQTQLDGKLTGNQTITLSGDVSGSGTTSISCTVANDSHTHDTRYYTESEISTFFDRGYISSYSGSNLAVGWYTIATNTGDRAQGEFQIWDTASSDHQSVIFNASHHFGTNSSNSINVLANSSFSGTNFRYIRIKEGGTYDGAALQVYIDGATNAVNVAIIGGNAQSSGWVLKNWVADATDPGDLTSYGSMTQAVSVDLDLISTGGLLTSGKIYSYGNMTTGGVFSGTATSARYADLAEKYMPDAEYTAGTVLQFGGEEEVTLADEYATRRVAGVVSTNPAFMMNESLEGGVYIALSGRVPCRVTGIVNPGDLIVASTTPGVATAWNDPLRDPPAGSIIGKAIKGKALAGEELIEVVVGVR